MKYTTQNVDINMTSLQGYITADYDTLEKLFGTPTEGDGYKIDAEWSIEFKDGTVATIYNWKDGKNYCGAEGIPVNDIKNWHIGGKTHRAVNLIIDTLK